MSAAAAGRAGRQDARRERRSAVPAGLAALGESGVLFLPVSSVVGDSVSSLDGPLGSYAWFLPLFVGTVVLGAALRRAGAFATGAAAGAVAVGVAQATVWGRGEAAPTVLGVLLALAVGLRAVSLALRDWRDPVGGSLAWGSAVLLGEVAVGAHAGWDGLLPIVVPQFFLAGLASRAASVTLYGGAGGSVHPGARRAAGMAAAGVGVLGAALAGAELVGGRGGAIQLTGTLVDRLVAALASPFLFLAVQLIRPFLWLAERLGLDPEGVRQALLRIRRAAGLEEGEPVLPPGSAIERVLGLLLLVAIAALLVWAVRRQRDRLAGAAWGDRYEEDAPARPVARPRRVRRRERPPRRELPENTVRRWYAEALVVLEGLGLPRPDAATTGEYLAEVSGAFPGAAAPFGRLTRAYEDVRYGRRRLDGGSLERLGRDRDGVLDALRRAPG